MAHIPELEQEIRALIEFAFVSSDPTDRCNARQFCDEVQSLVKGRNYFQTQLIDSTGSSFILQPKTHS